MSEKVAKQYRVDWLEHGNLYSMWFHTEKYAKKWYEQMYWDLNVEDVVIVKI